MTQQISLRDAEQYNLTPKDKIDIVWEYFKYTEEFFFENFEEQKLKLFETKLMINTDSNFDKSKNIGINKTFSDILSNPIYIAGGVGLVILIVKMKN